MITRVTGLQLGSDYLQIMNIIPTASLSPKYGTAHVVEKWIAKDVGFDQLLLIVYAAYTLFSDTGKIKLVPCVAYPHCKSIQNIQWGINLRGLAISVSNYVCAYSTYWYDAGHKYSSIDIDTNFNIQYGNQYGTFICIGY